MTLDQAINQMSHCNKLINLKRKKFLIEIESNPAVDDVNSYYLKLQEFHKDIREFIYKYVVNNIIPYINMEEIKAIFWELKQGNEIFLYKHPKYSDKLRLINILLNNIDAYIIDNNTKI